MSDKVLGWCWLSDDGCLQHQPYTKIEVGQTLTTEGPLELRNYGILAFRRALDALDYAEGATICRVELSGEILEYRRILRAQRCKVLAMADATRVLHEFMCWSGEQALLGERALGREPDKRSWAAIETKRKWLRGEATDEELDAARVASRGASWTEAACAATNAAARGSPWTHVTTAASIVASAAAWTEVGDADSAADRAATWAVAWAAQNAKLEEMLNDLLKESAKDA